MHMILTLYKTDAKFIDLQWAWKKIKYNNFPSWKITLLDYSSEHFTLGVRTKETQELNGGELNIGPKGFTLGIKTKVCQNDLEPMWHHFGAKISWS
jgi:hypothetical protein